MNALIDDSLYQDLIKSCNINKNEIIDAVLNQDYKEIIKASNSDDADLMFLE